MRINATLSCSECRRPTLHIFVERRPQAREPGQIAYVDLIYECDGCGANRVWGNEPRQATAAGRRLGEAAFSHAVDHHGMRRQECPACRGTGHDCAECNDDGEVWVFDTVEPCGPECPFATGHGRPVSG
jgi:hypothetical protein